MALMSHKITGINSQYSKKLWGMDCVLCIKCFFLVVLVGDDFFYPIPGLQNTQFGVHEILTPYYKSFQ